MNYNFSIESKGEVSDYFLDLGIYDFHKACKYVSNLSYKRNLDKNDILCVLKEQAGTCSTKHAILKKLALENSYMDVKLILGIFKMDKIYAPKIEQTLSQHNLDYIPEAHNYLKINDEYLDFTRENSKYSDFQFNLLEEHEIEYNQINNFKIDLHKNYLKNWILDYPNLTEDMIWKIREQCISDLQN